MTRSEHWNAAHTGRAPEEMAWFQPTPSISLDLLTDAGLDADSRVLDVGGGISNLVDALLDRGVKDVTVLDVSSVALGQSQRRLGPHAGQITWLVGDVLDSPLNGTHDFWHDRAVFHFLGEPEERRQYVTRLKEALLPGGHVLISTFAADGPDSCSGLPVTRYDVAGIRAELGEEFVMVDDRREEHNTPDGRKQWFHYFLFRRV